MLPCDEVGPGGSPIVLCLPWFGTSRAMTRDAFEPALAGAAVHQVYVDLPGHGDAGPAAEPTSEAVLAKVAGFIEERSEEPVLVAGASYGAYVAAALARRRPELVRGLQLVCPGVRRERDLPVPVELPAEPGWLDAAPAGLAGHFRTAVGRRTADVVRSVSAAMEAGGPGHEEYLDALQGALATSSTTTTSPASSTARWRSSPAGRTASSGMPISCGELPTTRTAPSWSPTAPGTTCRTSSPSCCAPSRRTG